MFGYLLVALALPALVYVGNPAVALVVGGAITLSLNRSPLKFGVSAGRYLLQTAIVLLGLRLNIDTLWQLSAEYSWGVAIYVLSTLALGLAIGRYLQVEAASSKLITAGTAICGGTAIATLGPVINAQPQQIGVALATVFLLNVVALFAFPLIGEALDMTQREFGLWSALAIHDTSSVVATAA
ncbi:MAG: putative sulfate exporter family transporter, partial [Gammaproteobacteria bacterium]|nr:putative sulfate exporter family transporter [Gammaproteobacteria bacterium]